MGEKIFLVDGSGYIFRAFYAIQPLSTREGFPTNALYGFTRMLVKLLQDAQADHLCVVFDAGRETFRTELYPDYKANRTECPPDLKKQMPYFRELTKALGIPMFEMPGFEADDILGTMARRLEAAGKEIVIVSGDKDLMQLVGDRIRVWDTMRDKWYGPAEVKEKFGVPPEQLVEYLAMTGDSSDNVPGLNGVGPKTAVELLAHFSGIESLIEGADQIAAIPSIRGRLKISQCVKDNADALRLSRKLVEIRTDVPVGEKEGGALAASLLRGDPDYAMLLDLSQRFEFASLVQGLKGSAKAKPPGHGRTYKIVYADDFPSFLEKLESVRAFAFDTETTSLDVKEASLAGAAFSWSTEDAYYIPFAHREVPAGKRQLSCGEFLERCSGHFCRTDLLKCGHNLKYDIGVLAEAGVEVAAPVFDTMIAAYLLNPDRRNYALDSLTRDYLHRETTSFLELTGDDEDITAIDIARVAQYAGDDAINCWELKQALEGALKENELESVFNDLEMPLVSVLSRMERKGIALDVDFLAGMSRKFEEEIEESRARIYAIAGCEFNLNSPKQLGEVMFDRLKIPCRGVKKTKSGFSTDQSVLESLSAEYELPRELLRYRMIFKLKSTYIDALPCQISRRTGRLHTSFHQTGTATGRLSSSDPNLQNIPVQSKEGRAVRRAFVPGDGFVLISADYSQIELRVLAHLSGDRSFIQAFVQGKDIHAETTRELMGIPEDEDVPPDLRRIGKTINFGIVYGMGAFRLSRELGIPVGEAQAYIDNYFERYPGIREVFASFEQCAGEQGYVKTLFGRRRVISEIDSSGRARGFSNRAAMNAPIQGTAADIVKAAMIRIDRRIQDEKLPLAMLLQIHDELLFECRSEAVDDMRKIIRHEMEHVKELRVPLKVEIGSGDTWEEAAHA